MGNYDGTKAYAAFRDLRKRTLQDLLTGATHKRCFDGADVNLFRCITTKADFGDSYDTLVHLYRSGAWFLHTALIVQDWVVAGGDLIIYRVPNTVDDNVYIHHGRMVLAAPFCVQELSAEIRLLGYTPVRVAHLTVSAATLSELPEYKECEMLRALIEGNPG